MVLISGDLPGKNVGPRFYAKPGIPCRSDGKKKGGEKPVMKESGLCAPLASGKESIQNKRTASASTTLNAGNQRERYLKTPLKKEMRGSNEEGKKKGDYYANHPRRPYRRALKNRCGLFKVLRPPALRRRACRGGDAGG